MSSGGDGSSVGSLQKNKETEFPAGGAKPVKTRQNCEVFGSRAYDEMSLSDPTSSPASTVRSMQPAIPIPSHVNSGAMRVSFSEPVTSENKPRIPSATSDSVHPLIPTEPVQLAMGRGRDSESDDMIPGLIYKPTVAKNNEKYVNINYHKPENLETGQYDDNDTTNFTQIVQTSFLKQVSPWVWIAVCSILCGYCLVMAFIGGFNLTSCPIRNQIPVYLLVFGIVAIIKLSLRIYYLCPQDRRPKRPQLDDQSVRSVHNGSDVFALILTRGVDLLISAFLTVWFVLGCVWVYGADGVVHSSSIDKHGSRYCEPFLYKFAWVTVTLQLGGIAIVFIGAALLTLVLVYRQSNRRRTHS